MTLGARGAIAIDAGARPLTAAPPDLDAPVVDTVGAGDALSAVLVLGLARGWPLARTLERAVGFAARVCRSRGAVPDEAGVREAVLAP